MSYEYEIWADGFRRWHAKITFTPVIGNTPEAQRIAHNALKNVKRQLRKTISRQDKVGEGFRFAWEIIGVNELSTGHLQSVTIAEREDTEWVTTWQPS